MMAYKVEGGKAGRPIYVVAGRREARTLYMDGVRDPIFFDTEMDHLRGLENDGIKGVADIKAVFPGAMVESTEFARAKSLP
jgi:hypothetical protein